MTQSQTSLSQADLESQLKSIVGDDKVKTDADSLETFGKDWTKIYPPNPSALYFLKPLSKCKRSLNSPMSIKYL